MNNGYVPKFESVDWVALARSMGIHLASGEPLQLSLISTDERQALAEHLLNLLTSNPKLPKGYASDYLDDMILEGRITSLDKAWVKFLLNKLRIQ
ncbi:hypothetical protein D3C80_1388880 [compost metagenome]